MRSNIKISIIIPTFNSEKVIFNCLKSLNTISNLNIEILFIDSVSSDRTVEIINQFNLTNSKVFVSKDNGIYDAMNRGVKFAKGDFIYFLGSDDLILSDFTQLYNKLSSTDTIYYSNVLINTDIYLGEFNLKKLLKFNISHQSIIYPRNILINNPYDLKYKYLADYVLNLKLYSCNYIFKYYPYTIAKYSVDGVSSHNLDLNFKKDQFKIIYKYFKFKGLLFKIINKL
jgi:glycosyltransferase involved in cell wall biosynthesis